MPINESLMRSLSKRYWAKKWKEIYYSMENDKNPAASKKAIAKSKKDHPSWYWIKKKEVKKSVAKKVTKKATVKKKTK